MFPFNWLWAKIPIQLALGKIDLNSVISKSTTHRLQSNSVDIIGFFYKAALQLFEGFSSLNTPFEHRLALMKFEQAD